VIKSTYGVWPDRKDCVAAAAAFPTTEAELVAAVASAVRDGRKVKVISRWAHSIPKLACPGGDQGLVISTAQYNTRVTVDAGRRTAEAQAGVDLRQLVDAAAQHGLALPYMPYWGGVSIAGLISTGAHGSSLFHKGGAVHEYVLALRLVVPAAQADGYARVIVLNDSRPEEFDAAKVGLGVLGAISTVIYSTAQ
jgi:FAD-dependent oxidoreductase